MKNKTGFYTPKKNEKRGFFADWESAPKKTRSFGRGLSGMTKIGISTLIGAATVTIIRNSKK